MFNRFSQNQKLFLMITIAFLYFLVGYFFTNYFQFFTPIDVYRFKFEESIPFMAWTSWIYCSDYVLIFIAFLLVRKDKNLEKYFYSFMLCFSIHFLFFFFLPTQIAHERFDLGGVNILNIPMYFVWAVDKPFNCFPSFHVADSFLGAFFLVYYNKKYFYLFLIWAILISLSTLTTKQHYFLDILGGIVTAYASYYFLLRGKKYQSAMVLKE